MTTKTANEPLMKAVLKPEVALPFATSVFIAGPCTAYSVILMQQHVNFQQPWLWMLAILGLSVLSLLAAVLLEPESSRIGRLTLPSLMGFVALVFLYVLADVFNRFITHVGYEWLLPFVIASQGLSYCGIFFEKHLALKALMGLLGMTATVLWCLGVMEKIALPF